LLRIQILRQFTADRNVMPVSAGSDNRQNRSDQYGDFKSLSRLWAARRYQSSLGANNDQAELHISSDEWFVVSSSTTGPNLIDSRRQAFSLR